jgi:two-component system, NarL family, invasion response regulator UvrY
MIKALIVDDHPLVRGGVKSLLAETGDIRLIGEVSNSEETWRFLASRAVDVLLLDISMPGESGIRMLHTLSSHHPNFPVIVLTAHIEEQYGIIALQGGASGYVRKDNLPSELVSAIRKVVSGGKYIGAVLAEKLVDDLQRGNHRPLHESLSDREHQVMRLIAQEMNIKEIARHIGLSEKTISTYRARILEKMKMDNNAELLHYAYHERFVE